MRRSHFLRGARASVLLSCALTGLGGCHSDLVGSDAYDVERYDLAGHYDWERDRLVATVAITLSTEPGVNAIALDSRVTEVLSVRTAEGEDRGFEVDGEAGTLTVDVSGLDADQGVSLLVEYEVAPSEALRAVPPRAGDPAAVRAVFSDSEPENARLWLPCHDRPDDRAVFSADMTMAAGEKMIANGTLLADEGGGEHRMKYQTEYPLPTYLMAFAISDFEVEEAEGGGVPLAVWHRKGVPGDYPGTLADLERLMDTFQGFLGPYPFERYSLVMLPDFGGGMENAGITFQSEISSAEPGLSLNLNAHELGHQWYGDAVTVATWDDVWIKEGMATLLEYEATRFFEDQSETGVLFGDRLAIGPGEAIRDRKLAPADKYTSGPYDRAAWLYTQIRSLVGEDVFWGTLRDLLKEHRFGTVSTDEVLAAFKEHLPAEAAAAAARAVDAQGLPSLDVAQGAGGEVLLTLHDPEGILVAPVELEWRREGGTSEKITLAPEQAAALARQSEGDLLVIDPADVHPDLMQWTSNEDSGAAYAVNLLPLTIPAGPGALAAFSDLPGIHQYAALLYGAPPLSPDHLGNFTAGLHADSARATALTAACGLAAVEEDPLIREEWADAVKAQVTAEPAWRGLLYANRPATCGGLIDPGELFAAEWEQLTAGLAEPTLTAERVNYLTMFDLPFQESIDVWRRPAKQAYSVRIRSMAARSLRRSAFLALEGQDLMPWRAAMLAVLEENDTVEVLRQLTPGAGWFTEAPLSDLQAFVAQMRRILLSPRLQLAHAQALCAAYVAIWPEGPDLQLDRSGEWEKFAAGLSVAPLSRQARRVLADPKVCL